AQKYADAEAIVTRAAPDDVGIDGPVSLQLAAGSSLGLVIPAKGTVDSAVLVIDYGKNGAGVAISTHQRVDSKPFTFTVPVDELVSNVDAAAKVAKAADSTTKAKPPVFTVSLYGKNTETNTPERADFKFTFGAS